MRCIIIMTQYHDVLLQRFIMTPYYGAL